MNKVLCVIEESFNYMEIDEDELWRDYLGGNNILSKYYWTKEQKIFPVYNHPHSDKENGQEEIHYHIDTRYIENIYTLNNKSRISLPLKNNQRLEYRMLKKFKNNEEWITPKHLTSNSKLKHKCIHKGKCPHRGYDLTNEISDENGIITCPLHGLRFDTKNNNKIINFEFKST